MEETLSRVDDDALAVGGSTSTTLQSALAWLYVEVPAEHPYQLYQFLDLDGMPGLEVVASSVGSLCT